MRESVHVCPVTAQQTNSRDTVPPPTAGILNATMRARRGTNGVSQARLARITFATHNREP